MSNRLATIQKIHSIQPHPNADNLVVAKVLEWPVVVKKNDFNEGDLIVFICIDSIVPSSNPYFQFMEKMKFKVWSAKFRGQPSQGLVCPLSILSSFIPFKEGDDVTDTLGVIKYEKPEPICAEAKGNFPSHLVPQTDELNFLSYPDALQEFRNKVCYITLKNDGSSCSVIYHENEFRVCSRRLEQKRDTGFWPIIQQYNLESKMINHRKSLAIQGEAIGPSLNGNRMGLTQKMFKVFNMKNVETGEWFSWDAIQDYCKFFELPIVETITPPFIFDDTWNIDRLKALANTVTYGKQPGEGIVLRPVYPEYSYTLQRQLSVKILNADYKQ